MCTFSAIALSLSLVITVNHDEAWSDCLRGVNACQCTCCPKADPLGLNLPKILNTFTSTPELPVKIPQIPSSRDHEAVHWAGAGILQGHDSLLSNHMTLPQLLASGRTKEVLRPAYPATARAIIVGFTRNPKYVPLRSATCEILQHHSPRNTIWKQVPDVAPRTAACSQLMVVCRCCKAVKAAKCQAGPRSHLTSDGLQKVLGT